ncbi:hypothetical protein SARC_04794 [Sphaeroforma arctica JP610]|uniref:Uncharacterized protein n=1 Tax=Sphaeroforma arctica JP610 TaxID=667725 RepID=A0A0L0G197_9EUKA|nr:hypothetical protein SARC_04794 [Sphaeroforma arctica JP610]KNC82927.1 hypothetical protein SARC_04794 [Sphaeroforma arctica JP610]|eukprot:XP_014156829.1 hypothetical protein SARC_04794 [Sphaeroforma arctica JP610]
MGTPPSPRKASVGCQDNQYGIKNMNVHYEADTSPNKLGKGNPTGSTISSKGGRSISATPASTISSSATNGPIHSPSSLSSFANSMSLRSGKFQPLSQMLKKRNAPELSAEDTQTLRDEWGGKNLKDVLEQAEDVFSSLDDQGDDSGRDGVTHVPIVLSDIFGRSLKVS